MPIDRNDLLRPLGGEDNLRLMCSAEDFQYTYSDSRSSLVTFDTPTYTVEVGYLHNRLSGGNGWCLRIWTKHRMKKIHHSDYISDAKLLTRTFEWATKYSLSF